MFTSFLLKLKGIKRCSICGKYYPTAEGVEHMYFNVFSPNFCSNECAHEGYIKDKAKNKVKDECEYLNNLRT